MPSSSIVIEDELPVLPSIAQVVARSRRVVFHPERVAGAVAEWGHLLPQRSSRQHGCHYFDGGRETVRWIFVLDVLNHCFWPEPGEPAWAVAYRGEFYSGYWGLAASLKRAMENAIPVTDAAYLARLRAGDLNEIFAGSGQIPLFAARLYANDIV